MIDKLKHAFHTRWKLVLQKSLVSISIRCRFTKWHDDSLRRLIEKMEKTEKTGKEEETRDKERNVSAIEATSSSSSSSSKGNPVFRILSTNNDSVAIPLQRACTPPQRRCLFGQLSMRRTQVELLWSRPKRGPWPGGAGLKRNTRNKREIKSGFTDDSYRCLFLRRSRNVSQFEKWRRYFISQFPLNQHISADMIFFFRSEATTVFSAKRKREKRRRQHAFMRSLTFNFYRRLIIARKDGWNRCVRAFNFISLTGKTNCKL